MLFCGIVLCKVNARGQTCPMFLVTVINLPYFWNNIPNNWSWGVLFITKIMGLLGVVYQEIFIVCMFEPVSFFRWAKISCGPGLLIEIMCWPISAPACTGKMPFFFVTVGDGGSYFSVAVCWSLPGLRILIIGIIIIFVCINAWSILLFSV